MSDERMPINLFTLDNGEKENEPTTEEFRKQKIQDCKPWEFLIGLCIAICLVMAFINFRVPDILAIWVWLIIYLSLACLVVLSISKITKIRNAK